MSDSLWVLVSSRTVCSPPGSSVHGILQARILEWVAAPFSRGSSQTRDQNQVSSVAGRFFTVSATRESTIASHSVVSNSSQPHGLDCSPPGSSVHLDSPGKNTGAGCHFLLQGIFPTQGLNPGLLYFRQILYPLSYMDISPLNVNASYKRITSTQFPEHLLCLLFYLFIF